MASASPQKDPREPEPEADQPDVSSPVWRFVIRAVLALVMATILTVGLSAKRRRTSAVVSAPRDIALVFVVGTVLGYLCSGGILDRKSTRR